MGFPSPAQDYEDKGISLDERFIMHPSATYFMRAGSTYYCYNNQRAVFGVITYIINDGRIKEFDDNPVM